ncbi:MAG: hypothetical protein AAGE99_01195 [Chlamydiota bacterium]
MSDVSRVAGEETGNVFYQRYDYDEDAVTEIKGSTNKEAVGEPDVAKVKAETVAREKLATAQITEKAENEREGSVQKLALPTVKLKKITRKAVRKKDAALVKAHIPSTVKRIEWDEARDVIVIAKSGKERAYRIGSGAAPAVKEGNRSDVIAYLEKM